MALLFNGVDSYVDCGDDALFSFGDASSDIPCSIMSWINMIDATNFPILSKIYDSTATIEWMFTTLNDTLRFQLYDDVTTSNIRRISDVAITAYEGQWIHVAATYDGESSGNGIVLYLNGDVLPSTAGSSGSYTAMSNTNAGMEIGVRFRAGGANKKFANGNIAETSLWRNKVLTLAEIQSYRNRNLSGGESGLVGYWPIADKGSGIDIPIKDISGGGNPGTMNNFAGNPWRSGPPIILGRAA